jgi:hypothetical protein
MKNQFQSFFFLHYKLLKIFSKIKDFPSCLGPLLRLKVVSFERPKIFVKKPSNKQHDIRESLDLQFKQLY